MKKNILSLCFFCYALLLAAQSSHEDFYLLVGTYTKRTSEGIYTYRFNAKTGAFSAVGTTKDIKNPSFLAIAPNQKWVYAVSESPTEGGVLAYYFDKKTGQLTFINQQPSGGGAPCHLEVDKTGKCAIVGNYVGGNLSILPLAASGALMPPKQTIQHQGKSINAKRQESPHVHSVNIAANNRDVFVADLGTDKIYHYTLNAKNATLIAAKNPFISVTEGSGPRHFAYHPTLPIAYLLQELAATVTTFKYENGTLTPFQIVETLPQSAKENVWSADIHLSPDGKFLYGTNRSNNEIFIFSIHSKTGNLAFVGSQSVEGKVPRNFAIDPTGNFLLVANQESDDITIFKRDKKTGKLIFTGQKISVSMPVCLKFVPAK
jgi:6-phosphogluconolactonase